MIIVHNEEDCGSGDGKKENGSAFIVISNGMLYYPIGYSDQVPGGAICTRNGFLIK